MESLTTKILWNKNINKERWINGKTLCSKAEMVFVENGLIDVL